MNCFSKELFLHCEPVCKSSALKWLIGEIFPVTGDSESIKKSWEKEEENYKGRYSALMSSSYL